MPPKGSRKKPASAPLKTGKGRVSAAEGVLKKPAAQVRVKPLAVAPASVPPKRGDLLKPFPRLPLRLA